MKQPPKVPNINRDGREYRHIQCCGYGALWQNVTTGSKTFIKYDETHLSDLETDQHNIEQTAAPNGNLAE